ncbi:hypothetical protein Pmani_005136 [Petrolisthes manimaculis]|uniref:Reverse transcriptase domain-containing protein n=1 Tax=Petrolisthes manimaculis TaxID=1843537 RepID=A0AAE1QDG3_9EUCA|nr:hypothetical protein Pmani_005136 [Petrolisthes manimaculis]
MLNSCRSCGPWHSHLFDFVKRIGTTTAIASLLSMIKDRKAISVNLDLEKAFKFANSHAILKALAEWGGRGQMRAWVQDYLLDRTARVKYQGRLGWHDYEQPHVAYQSDIHLKTGSGVCVETRLLSPPAREDKKPYPSQHLHQPTPLSLLPSGLTI